MEILDLKLVGIPAHISLSGTSLFTNEYAAIIEFSPITPESPSEPVSVPAEAPTESAPAPIESGPAPAAPEIKPPEQPAEAPQNPPAVPGL